MNQRTFLVGGGSVHLRAAAPLHFDEARLTGELQFLLQATRFAASDAAAALAAWLLAPPCADTVHPPLDEVTIALPGARLTQRKEQQSVVVESKAFGFVDVIYETTGCGVYRERVSPHQTVPTHVHRELEESELVLGDGLLLQGQPVAAGLAHEWPRNFAHRYDNPTERELSFMCIDRPKFVPSDEVEVEVPTAQLRSRPATRFF